MKLQEKETNTLNTLIDSYKEIHGLIKVKQSELKFLEFELNELVKGLEINRLAEKQFADDLEFKYGKGKFNQKTMEYELD